MWLNNNLNNKKMNIYIGNLDYSVSEKDLEKLFGEFGTVSSAAVIMDKYNNRSKGFAFVTMENKDDAEKAIKELNGKMLLTKSIIVNEARQRKERY
jgi:RNA recognition motif-containing protein